MLDWISCIGMVSLKYRFFLQKQIWIIFNVLLGNSMWIVCNSCIYRISFRIVSSYWHSRIFMFLFCKKMPICISCICMVSLQYKFFLQKINLHILQRLYNCSECNPCICIVSFILVSYYWNNIDTPFLAMVWFLFGVNFFWSSESIFLNFFLLLNFRKDLIIF